MTEMSPAEAIFSAALEKTTPAERVAFLDAACSGQPDLRARVEKLLAAHPRVGGFLEPEARAASTAFYAGKGRQAAANQPSATEGMVVAGRYKLLQQIGEGGMGSVWMADQTEPVKRRVALKLIRVERANTKMILSRFEAERQAIALMDHPHIARLLDAGTTDVGQPYFVMELVKGIPVTDYCDAHKLGIPERLGLFRLICSAVQHAHQKGIIHRDLKPRNILVESHDGKAVPKVIDFGLAKATTGMQLSDHTLFTAFGTVMGTPTYMAPEQATFNAVDVDTRADVYSLGVILYELLTGTTPITRETVKKAAFDEVLKLVREQEAPKPSSRLSTAGTAPSIAANRNIDPAKLSRLLRGDMDWVVLKALEKDRTRRYETANGLAADILRHLSHEPVIARPPSAIYRMQKAWQRNKLACIAGAAIAASLVIGLAASVWQGVRAEREATRARSAEQRAVAALVELRATAPAFADQARALAAKEQFGEAIEKLDYAVKLRPDAAEFLVAKGDLLQCQMKLAAAAAVYRDALRLKPGLARAQASAKLCDELLAARPNADGKLTRESLAKLHLVMQQQQRPSAELMPVARLLGEAQKLIVEYWLARLKDLPVSAEKPLKDRLTVRDDGRLALDLSDTKVTDLLPLVGAPLAVLDVSSFQGRSELTDLSPLRGLDLIELNISATSVADLTPLREMHTLEKLEMSASKVTDLAALSALRLRSLNFQSCRVSDLTPIRKMPLEEISLHGTRVADLSPLIGLPIKSIDLSQTPVLDFSPLARLPLEKCYLEHCRITDLSVLRGKPLKELVLLDCQQARNYTVLAEIETLELLVLSAWYRNLPAGEYEAIGALRHHPKLRQLGAGVFNAMERVEETKSNVNELGYAATGSKEIFWQEWDRDQTFLPALRKSGIKFNLHKHLGGRDHLEIFDQPLRDLSILQGAPISMLTLGGCPFSDLTPIHELKLKVLVLTTDFVADLSPLRGMPLETVSLSGSKFSDLSPLAGLPIKALYLDACQNVTDVAALAQIPTLEYVTIPLLARNIEELRKLPKLERIAFSQTKVNVDLVLPDTSAAEFWKEYAANGWIRQLRDSGIKAKTLKQQDDGTWELNLERTKITDLTILHGAPISGLSLAGTAISDLTPLRGMALKRLHLYATNVTDLSPLEGMSLTSLNLVGTKVTDLSVLRGMPLFWLSLANCTEITDLSPLADCKALLTLSLPPNAKNFEFLRAFPELERIAFHEDPKNGYRPEKTAAEFWKEYDGQARLRALRELGFAIKTLKPLPDGTWEVDLSDASISDLTVLSGAPISILSLARTAVSDLAPLRGMAIKKLWLTSTEVTDLTPLQGIPLELLSLNFNTKVADLSALRAMPLVELRLHRCSGITDLSALADSKALRFVVLPPNAKNIEFLRTFPKLERLSFQDDSKNNRPDKTAAEFWKEYDAKQK